MMPRSPSGNTITGNTITGSRPCAQTRLTRVVLAAVCGTVAAVLAGPGHAGAAPAQTTLTVTSAKAMYATGEAPALTVTVDNHGSTACRAAGSAEGTVQVLSMTRDGAPVQPRLSAVSYYQGFEAALSGTVTTLEPGQRLSFPVALADGALLEVAPLPGGDALASLWPVSSPGRYELTVAYRVPPVGSASAGASRCGGLSDPARVSFTIAGQSTAATTGWPLVLLIVAVALVLGLGVVLWLRSRRRRATPAGAAAVVIIALGLPAGLPGVGGGLDPAYLANRPIARATEIQQPSPMGFDDAVAACFKIFTSPKGDPRGIIKDLLDPNKPTVTISSTTADPKTINGQHGPGSSLVYWNKDSTFYHADDGKLDPCAELYHELFHAWQKANGTERQSECDDTGLPIAEVEASFAENQYRASVNGLVNGKVDKRTTYGKRKLPDSLDSCKKPPTNKPKQTCLGPGELTLAYQGLGPCGDSTGDPHLVTFDQRSYDFQAVGEFLAVQARAGDLTVQTRQSPFPGSRRVSVNTAVAMRVGTDRLGFYLAGGEIEVHLNGQVLAAAPGATPLPGHGVLRRDASTIYLAGDGYTVVWPDGSTAWIDPIGSWGMRLSMALVAARKGQVAGLLGDDDANPDNDVVTRSGTALAIPASFEQLYPGFADSWRVTPAESLFDYAAGQSTDTYTDRALPDRPATPTDLPAPTREQAEAICRWAGVSAPALLAACIVDVGLTGQPSFAVGAGDSQTQRPATAVTTVESALAVTTAGVPAVETFPGIAGQKVFIDVVSATVPDACGVVVLRAPNTDPLGSTCLLAGKGFIDTVTLPVTGEYAIVFNPGATATGSVRLRRTTVVDQESAITPGGPPVTAAVASPGGAVRLRFAAIAGQKVFVDYTSTLPEGCGLVRLLNPKQENLAGGCVVKGAGLIDGTVLPTTGTYTLLVDPAGASTGETILRLIPVADELGAITIGGPPVVATVSQPGAVSRLRFTATAGQKVGIELTDSTVPSSCVTSLRKPNGDELAAGCIVDGRGFVDGHVLPATGEYTIVIDPGARDIGRTTVRLFAITDQQGSIGVGGPDVTVTIGQPGGVARLTFAGTAGQQVTVEVTASTLPSQCGVVSLRDPSGNEVASGCIVDGKGGINTRTLPVTGQYSIVVDPGWPGTGTAVIRLRT